MIKSLIFTIILFIVKILIVFKDIALFYIVKSLKIFIYCILLFLFISLLLYIFNNSYYIKIYTHNRIKNLIKRIYPHNHELKNIVTKFKKLILRIKKNKQIFTNKFNVTI